MASAVPCRVQRADASAPAPAAAGPASGPSPSAPSTAPSASAGSTVSEDVAAYLRRIGFWPSDGPAPSAPIVPDLPTLQRLHLCHIRTVPFDNLTLHRPADRYSLSQSHLFDKIVRRRLGGFCFELNGLFGWLLHALGFRVETLLAQVNRTGAAGGAESAAQLFAEWSNNTHSALVVTVPVAVGAAADAKQSAPSMADANANASATAAHSAAVTAAAAVPEGYEHRAGSWLVDVGFGWPPAGPLPFVLNRPFVCEADGFAYLLTRSAHSPFFFPTDEIARTVAVPTGVIDAYEAEQKRTAAAAPTAAAAAPAAPATDSKAASAAVAATKVAPASPTPSAAAAADSKAAGAPDLAVAAKHAVPHPQSSRSVWYVLHRYAPKQRAWVPRIQFPFFTTPLTFPDEALARTCPAPLLMPRPLPCLTSFICRSCVCCSTGARVFVLVAA
jgi:arylamine N-acetyltransferase